MVLKWLVGKYIWNINAPVRRGDCVITARYAGAFVVCVGNVLKNAEKVLYREWRQGISIWWFCMDGILSFWVLNMWLSDKLQNNLLFLILYARIRAVKLHSMAVAPSHNCSSVNVALVKTRSWKIGFAKLFTGIDTTFLFKWRFWPYDEALLISKGEMIRC